MAELDTQGLSVRETWSIYRLQAAFLSFFRRFGYTHSSLKCSMSCNGSMSYQDKGVIKLTGLANGKIAVSGVCRCKSRSICPVCANIDGKVLGAEVGSWARSLVEAGGRGYLLTLTISHNKGQSLLELLEQLAKGWSELRKRGFFSNTDWCRSIEILYNRRTGWHVHYHLLAFGQGFDFAGKVEELFSHWCQYHTNRGFKAVRQAQSSEAVFDAGGAGDYLGKIFGAGLEVGHLAGKTDSVSLCFADLFTSDDPFLQKRACEYFDAVRRRKMFSKSSEVVLEIKEEFLEAPEKAGDVYVAIEGKDVNKFLFIIHEKPYDFSGGISCLADRVAETISQYGMNASVLDECLVSFNNDH